MRPAQKLIATITEYTMDSDMKDIWKNNYSRESLFVAFSINRRFWYIIIQDGDEFYGYRRDHDHNRYSRQHSYELVGYDAEEIWTRMNKRNNGGIYPSYIEKDLEKVKAFQNWRIINKL